LLDGQDDLCIWYANMTTQNFHMSWCVCAAPSVIVYGFLCRAELCPDGNLYYPGCYIG
jgi:hypothetical protein